MIGQEQFVNFQKIMRVDTEKFIEEFQLKNFGVKGWKNSKLISCPHCGKDYTKFGILLLKNGGVYKCFRCDIKGSIFKLLRFLERKDLIIGEDDDRIFTYKEKLDLLLKIENKNEIDVNVPTINLPIGFTRIFENDYLTSRGWTKDDFNKIEVGVSDFPRFRERLIFLLREDSKLVGYLSRSTKSKVWHENNIKNFKEGKEKLVLRYDNSKTEFEKILGGIDDIIEGETDTVIIVEGLFDKVNVDRVLNLNNSSKIKCVCSFGCHFSLIQSYKLYERGIKNIILMFDSKTIRQTKSVSLMLSNYFNIFISELKGDKDPGEMNLYDFDMALTNLITPINFFVERLEKINLQ